MKKKSQAQKKVSKVMRKHEEDKPHSGSKKGPVVLKQVVRKRKLKNDMY